MGPKRHHYVPDFLLAHFSPEPTASKPKIWRLDVTSGTSFETGVANEAVIKHFNRLENSPELDPLEPERRLDSIENRAAPLIRKMIAGSQLSAVERLAIAEFVWMQYQRTPLGRRQSTFFKKQASKLLMIRHFSDPKNFRALALAHGECLTDEELRQLQIATIMQIVREDSRAIITHDQEVLGMFDDLEQGSELIMRRMSWLGLRAPAGSEFILSDHPLAFFDPTAADGDPVAWESSHSVEVTLPLYSSLCLKLIHGPESYRELEVPPEVVRNVNLRTYAWAHWCIYGSSNEALERVHSEAIANPVEVAQLRPRPVGVTIFEEVKGHPERNTTFNFQGPNRGERRRQRA